MVCVADIILDPPAEGQIVDPMSWFDSPGPFEIEIGCGKGGFLLHRAQAHPELRLLGLEWANKYFKYCTDRMARWGLNNVRVMRTDAKYFVTHHLPAGSVDVLHVYHPDPWPKKRHHKRRLFQPDFLSAVVRVLKPGGLCLIQSDHLEYFQIIQQLLGSVAGMSEVPWEEHVQNGPEWAGTNFEVKYARQGRTILRAAYVRG